MRCVKVFVVFSMAALNLAVMAGSHNFNQLVTDTKLVQSVFKESFLRGSLRVELVRELCTVVRLNTLDGVWKFLNAMPDEFSSPAATV